MPVAKHCNCEKVEPLCHGRRKYANWRYRYCNDCGNGGIRVIHVNRSCHPVAGNSLCKHDVCFIVRKATAGKARIFTICKKKCDISNTVD